MAELANIVLNDKTPTARTFKPAMKNGLLTLMLADYAAKPALHPTMTIGMRAPKPGVNRKVTIRVSVPYEVVSGDATTIEEVTSFLDYVISPNAPLAAVQDCAAFTSNASVNAIIKDLIDNGMYPF